MELAASKDKGPWDCLTAYTSDRGLDVGHKCRNYLWAAAC